MYLDLKMDESKEIFTLDKDTICFRVNSDIFSKLSSHSSINAVNFQPTFLEEEIHIKNLTSEYLAFEIKATKRIYYTVKPNYCIIPPKAIKS